MHTVASPEDDDHEPEGAATQHPAPNHSPNNAGDHGSHASGEHGDHEGVAHHNNILGVRGMYVHIPGDAKGEGSLWGGRSSR
jgi:hypothetical protein